MINEAPLSSPNYRKIKKRKPQQLLEVPSVRLLNSLALGRRGRFAICCFTISKVKRYFYKSKRKT